MEIVRKPAWLRCEPVRNRCFWLRTVELGGPAATLDALFADWIFVRVADSAGRHYPAPDGYVLFHGLPGALRKDCALFIKPHEAVRRVAESHLANEVIGAFRCVRSAHYMKDDLLPVYVTDPQHIARPLLALALRPAHSRCHQILWPALPEGFNHFVTSMIAPVASGWSI